MQAIQIGFTKSSLLYFQELLAFQFFEVCPYTSVSGTHIRCKLDLTGIARGILPSIFEQHRIGELGANRDVSIRENEIGNLREAVARGEIGTNYFDVSFL